MFTMVRRFIKTGIVFLFAGLGLGSWILVGRELRGVFPHPHLVSAHVHAVQVGFVVFLILGVALWLFPRAPKGGTRYTPGRIAASYWILTAATTVRLLGEVGRTAWESHALSLAVVLAGLGQVVGLALYFWTMWERIRPVGSHLREARGERF